jgi:gamma-glutamylcyclotransferase (GGCT)/AIG2-like uncharacterized protein YtfP
MTNVVPIYHFPRFIAVYGSLRVGESANAYMSLCEYVGVDTINATLHGLGWFPGVELGGGPDDKVVVDVYRLPEVGTDEYTQVVEHLDRYEGYNSDYEDASLFVRKVDMTLEGKLPVFVYEYNHKAELTEDNQVASGDWTKREEELV